LSGRSGGLLSVHPVDRGLVRLAPGPESQRRRRAQERPAVKIRVGFAKGPHQRTVALAEPAEQPFVLGPLLEHLFLGQFVHWVRDPVGHDPGRPPVHVRGVP